MENTKTVTPASTVRQSDDQVSCELDGETVLMHLESGAYFGYDPVGSRVWQLLAEPVSVETLCRQLVEEFTDVDLDQCTADVLPFLEELCAEGLIEVVPAPQV